MRRAERLLQMELREPVRYLIKREQTILKTKITRYQLVDNFFFYMRFINPMKDKIELGRVDYVIAEITKT